MRFSQLLEGVGEQCRRHPILDQQRRREVISLPFKVLRISCLHQGCRCSRKQGADVADVESPECSYSGTMQQHLQAVATTHMTQFVGEYRQNLLIIAN